MHFNLHAIDLAVIALSLGFTVFMGLWYSRHAGDNKEEFFLAGRSLTWPLIGASLFAANISSQQFVGQGGLAFSLGIGAVIFQLVGSIAIMVFGLILLPMYLRRRLFTLPQFMEDRFGREIRLFLSGTNIFMLATTSLSGVLYSGSIVMQKVLGFQSQTSLYTGVVIIAALFGLYAFTGGLKSVAVADFIQNIIMILGGFATLCFCLYFASNMPEGLSGLKNLIETLPDGRTFSKWSWVRPADHPVIPWMGVLTGAFIVALYGHATDHDYVQRGLGAKNLYHAKMGALFASLLKIFAVFMIGMPCVIGAYILQGENIAPDQAYAALIMKVLPIGATGLVLSALIAAVGSTVSSTLTACSSLFTVDFYVKKSVPIDEKKIVRVGRLTMAVILLFAILWTPIIASFGFLYVYLQTLGSYIAAPIFICYLAGFFYKRANKTGAMATLIIGEAIGLGMFFITSLQNLATATFNGIPAVRDALLALHHTLPSWLTGINFMYGCFFHFIVSGIIFLIFTHLSAPQPEPDAANQVTHDMGDYADEPPYAAKRLKILTVIWLVCLITVLAIFF
ncbi:MAG: hypothetical protein A2268_15795 [Candidatus Raymondbacteria bacterium RifOxyA12_full_50_37]|uniref:Sodium transporter n=1 Tax=Candidatus Raymondbacteria bacterium RIFOXYD12_FULL_49_13 TaxID=1817890 RepID=A0A1F7FJY4_UNCRA|nr:MAG: hypothetical protein A2268_15795 [Candidatus Raymondbacteria bacterium RifOxyA12_full_50_37]OGJ87704.1 MAG: hypothetical protein A2248_07500 [Candidatus Raymondbacteria bacterium RIFOXYA2_FULL_49_16]OGJ96507.1 MAG: hypothetical protein A2453_00120 [Candidatus Raymondbacteria bacterium RIFOXYC2_FULL_50_21]OGJ99701.1 MAG: hypothetical protein A2487_18660 [Candidatus Raymondbacteria bacterium RifOxyC12_full_50_8]OGK06787.1 MAG: hypothetical protein A2519_00970 [Candidatus Raymondbacteria b